MLKKFFALRRRLMPGREVRRAGMVLATLVALVVSFAAVGAASLAPASAATPARAGALRASIARQLNAISAHAASKTTAHTHTVTARHATAAATTNPPKPPTPSKPTTHRAPVPVPVPTATPAPKPLIAVSTPSPTSPSKPTSPSTVTTHRAPTPTATPASTPAGHQARANTADDTAPSDTYTLSAATQSFLAGLNLNLGSGPVTGTLSGTTLTVQVGAPALPITLPVGNDAISFGGASLTIDESTGTLTLSATATTADGASGTLSVSIAHSDTTTLTGSTDGADLSATVTLSALPVLGTTVDLTGTLAYTGGSVSASLTGTLDQDTVIASNVLTVAKGSTITVSTTDGVTLDGTAVIGSGNAQFTIKLSGAFSDEKNWNFSVDDDTNAPSFSPVSGLTITPAFSGSVQDKAGTISFDVSADQPLSWTPTDNVTVAVSHVEVSNQAPPTSVACPAGVKDGQLWVDVQGDLSDSAAGLDTSAEACVDPSAQTFTLTGTGQGAFGPSNLGFTLNDPTVTVDGDLKAGTFDVSATATLALTAVSGTPTIPVTLSFDSDGSFTAGATVDLSSVGLSSAGTGSGTLLVSSKEIKSFTSTTLGITTAIDLPAGVTVLLQYTPSQSVLQTLSLLKIPAPKTFNVQATLSTSGFQTTLSIPFGDGTSGIALLPSNAAGVAVYLNSVSLSLDISETNASISIGGSAFLQLPALYAGSAASSVELSLNGSLTQTDDSTKISVGFDLDGQNGPWTTAFGIPGLSIGELAASIGVEVAPEQLDIPLPTLSFTVNNVVLPSEWENAIGELPGADVSATLDLDVDNPILSFAISAGAGQPAALEPLRIADDFTDVAGTSPLPDSVVDALQVQQAQLLFAPTGGKDATGVNVDPGATLAFDGVIGGVSVHMDGNIGLLPYPHLIANASADGFHLGTVQFQNTTLGVDLEANPTDPKIDFDFDGGFTDQFTGTQFSADVDLGASISALNASVNLHIAGGQPQYIQGGADLQGSVYLDGSGFGFSASGYAGLVVNYQSLGQVYFSYTSEDGAIWQQLAQLPGQVAQAFKDAYGWTDAQVASALNSLHYGGTQIASALSSVYNDSIAQITTLLTETGDSFYTAITDVQAALNASNAQIAAALNQLGESTVQIASQLQSWFGAGPSQIASAFQSAFGYSDAQVASLLQQIGFSPDQIASALQSAFGDTQAAVYNALQQIGDGGQSVLDSIAGFFNTGSYWIYSNPWYSVPLFVDDSGGSQAPFNPIVQWTWNGGHNQDWYVLPTDSGYAEIVNRNSGQCLSEFGGAGAQLIQYPCYGWSEQQWYLGVYPGQNLNYTGHTVTNRWSGLDLDVNGGSTSAGAAIDTWYGNGNWNQWFTFEPAIG